MRTGCHNSSGRWQVATCDEHGMQGGWPSAWEHQWVSAMTQLVTKTLERGDLAEPWTSTGRPRMSTWACHGQRWSDTVVETIMKDLEGLQWYHLEDRSFPSPFSCLHLVKQSTMVEVLQDLQGNPRSGQGEAAPIASTNTLLQKKHFYFLLQNLILGNSVFYYFWSEFLQVFELKLTRLLFFQMNVAFFCTMLSLLV